MVARQDQFTVLPFGAPEKTLSSFPLSQGATKNLLTPTATLGLCVRRGGSDMALALLTLFYSHSVKSQPAASEKDGTQGQAAFC